MKGCQNCCHPNLFKAFELIEEDYVPGTDKVHEYDEELEQCPVCHAELNANDFIVIDEEHFLDEALEYMANEINQNIYECQYCNWTIIPYEQQYGDPMDLNIISSLVDSYEIPADLQPRLYGYLKCNCGNSVSSDDPYVTKEKVNEWLDDEIEFIVETFNISGEETEEFIQFLQRNPMLGLAHPVGQKIYKKIEDGDLPGIEEIKAGEVYYRGRTRNKLQRLVPFIEEELWNPPIGIPQQGRYNPPGVTSLYLGNKQDAILLEIAPSNLDIVDIAEFEVKSNLKVFNTTQTDVDIFAGMTKGPNGLIYSYEYIFPNFLAQCLAYHGFNGIIYKSVKDTKALNICLFNFSQDEDICMKKIHVNANILSANDPFGLGPKKKTIIIEPKAALNITDLF